MRSLLPVAQFLEGLPFVITGRASLRMQGLGCSVPYVDVVVSHPAGQSGDSLWQELADRCTTSSMQLWSPSLCRYRRIPSRHDIADAAAASQQVCRLCFRSRETATELRMRVLDGALPPHAIRRVAADELPLLALSQYSCANGRPLVDYLPELEGLPM